MIALAAAYSDERNAPALHATNRDVVANSTRLSRDSRLRLFEELHHKWFGSTLPWIPLSPFSVTAVGAMLKAGRYSSGANYISAARVFSRDCGYAEHPLLGHAVRKAVQSIERGVGQQKQTHALPLQRMDELPGCDTPWVKGGPVGPADTFIISC